MIKELLGTAETKMQKTISVLTSDLTTLKAGRANPKMLDRIQVEAYGGLCPIEQVGNISAPLLFLLKIHRIPVIDNIFPVIGSKLLIFFLFPYF